ncbi:hypothetical protein [Terrarubrum flagellatum]|uniref:hypothetical protein n=1 Tax=Terrirubrum flagellatum TaxID=2895980 RepID=UPI00314561E9
MRRAVVKPVSEELGSELDGLVREFRLKVFVALSRLPPQDAKTLHGTVVALLSVGYEQKDLCETVGVSRHVLNKWASGEGIPRFPSLRAELTGKLRRLLVERPEINFPRSAPQGSLRLTV